MTDKTVSPYRGLPRRAFWKAGFSIHSPSSVPELYGKKFEIDTGTAIATAGSCFAQHIARHLKRLGYNVLDREPCPRGVNPKLGSAYGYGIYSARYGNIYYTRQLLQLTKEALGLWSPSDWIWTKKGRFFDALRPSVEPNGLSSVEEVVQHRRHHLKHVRHVIENCDLFVFTLGLTEAWVHQKSGTVYPTAPGTVIGSFDPSVIGFENFGFKDVRSDFLEFKRLVEGVNPDIKFLLTVSPVPLAATASKQHVLPASVFSKSTLRAVAGDLCEEFENIDYFPSYEIITNVLAGAQFFDGSSGLREVTSEGVETAMSYFFSQHSHRYGASSLAEIPDEQVFCEEVLLESMEK